MQPRREYLPADSMYPMMGLNTLEPSTQLNPSESPELSNVMVEKGLLAKRKGYQVFGGPLPNEVIGVIQFETSEAVKWLVAITLTRQFKYADGAWVDITYNDGVDDVEWSGTETDLLDWTVAVGLDGDAEFAKWLIITNGKDPPRYWDGTTDTFELFEPDITGFVTCQCLSMFYGRLLLGNITTTTHDRQLVVWSAAGELLDFTSPGSGGAIVTDAVGDILRLVPLGDRLVIYSENAIGMISYIAGLIIFTFEVILQETRLVSARSIVNIGPYHLFMSQENVQLFDGSRLHTPIADKIYRSYRNELYVPKKHKAFAFHDTAKGWVFFVVPTGDSTTVVYVLEYVITDWRQARWTRHVLGDNPTAMGYYSRDSSLTWDSPSLVGLTWDDMSIPWSQGSTKEGFPVRVFGTINKVMLFDDVLPNDNGNPISSHWDSKDFTPPTGFRSQFGRWIEIEVEMMGLGADVMISMDEGITYTLARSIVLTGGWTKYNVFIDEVSERLRVRIQNNVLGGHFVARWLRVWVTPSGPS